MGHKAEPPRRARAARVPRHVLPQGAKTGVREFADIQKFALHVHCMQGAQHSPYVLDLMYFSKFFLAQTKMSWHSLHTLVHTYTLVLDLICTSECELDRQPS